MVVFRVLSLEGKRHDGAFVSSVRCVIYIHITSATIRDMAFVCQQLLPKTDVASCMVS